MIDFKNSIKKFTARGLDNNYRHGVSYLKIAGIISDIKGDYIKEVSNQIVQTARRNHFKTSYGRVLDIRGMEGKETNEEQNMVSYLQFKQS